MLRNKFHFRLMKTCDRCGVQKPLADFYKNSKMASGYLHQCKECVNQYKYSWQRANKHRRYAYSAAYWAKYPLKYQANITVGNAIRDGKLQRQPCVICGAEKTEGHHPDYSKPLDVVWLCPPCHRQTHAKEREKTRMREEGSSLL